MLTLGFTEGLMLPIIVSFNCTAQTKMHFPTDFLIMIYSTKLQDKNDRNYQPQLQEKILRPMSSWPNWVCVFRNWQSEPGVSEPVAKHMLSQVASVFDSQTWPPLHLSLMMKDSSFLRIFRKSCFTCTKCVN